MTYPPQQPPGGQNPWGQQPDPYGGQGPWGQQPDPYGGQSPWGQQPFPVGPPPKKKGGLMAALIIVAVLVVGGGGAGLYFLLSKDDEPGGGGTSTEEGPRAAADAFAETMEPLLNETNLQDLDISPLKPLTCADDYQKLDEEVAGVQEEAAEETSASSPPTRDPVKLSVADFKESDGGATFNLHYESEGGNEEDRELEVVEEKDKWVVCGLYADDETTSPPSSGGSSPDDGPDTDIPNPIPTT